MRSSQRTVAVAAQAHGQLLPIGEDFVQPVPVDVATAHLVGVGRAASKLRIVRPGLLARVVVAVQHAAVADHHRLGLLVEEVADDDIAAAVPGRPLRLAGVGVDAPCPVLGRVQHGESPVAVQVEHGQSAFVTVQSAQRFALPDHRAVVVAEAFDPGTGMLAAAAEDVRLAVGVDVLHLGDDRVEGHARHAFKTLHRPGLLHAGDLRPVGGGDLQHVHPDDLAPLVLAEGPLALRTQVHVGFLIMERARLVAGALLERLSSRGDRTKA